MQLENETELPVLAILAELRDKLAGASAVILEAAPGSGKSTIVPWKLLDEPWLRGQKIVMMEPRRLAAKAVATRMATLLGEPIGKSVGYRVRFDTKVSRETRIEVVTEGILTRQLQRDNALEGVGLVICDEFHERSLAADLALVLLRQSQQLLREDLRILIMSATLESSSLSHILAGAPVVKAEGRQYPLTYRYLPQEVNNGYDSLSRSMNAAIRLALRDNQGDILAFLPGAGEIHKTAELLTSLDPPAAQIHTLYGDLPPKAQQAAIERDPQGRRKIVLATAIAETSLTIEGVSVVIDSGFSRVSRFDPRSGLSRLETVRVTRDAADQRAGRAGRLGPGVVYRLWAEPANHTFAPARVPEILEADLASMALELANWSVIDLNELNWITPPPPGNFAQARQLLFELHALAPDGRISEKGRAMLALPTHPRIAHMLLEARDRGLLAVAIDLAALLEERDPLPKESGADITLRVEALERWRRDRRGGMFERIDKLAQNWRRLLRTDDESHYTDRDIGRLIAAAYPERIAQATDQKGRYRLSNSRFAKLPEHDPLTNEPWIAIASMDAGGNLGKIYSAAPLDVADLDEYKTEQKVVEWDERTGQLNAHTEIRIGGITIQTKPLSEIPDEQRASVVLQAIRDGGIRMLPMGPAAEEWRSRVASVRIWHPELSLPDVSDSGLLESAEEWLRPYLTKIRRKTDIDKLDIASLIRSRLTWEEQKAVDRFAPETVEVPSGSRIKLEYFPDGRAPVLAVRLQEVFGLIDTPTVNAGATKVLMHLLSPGYKPVQVTQDLRSFWEKAYPEVRKELRIRYQKHSWPEDPWNAEAVRGAKRRK